MKINSLNSNFNLRHLRAIHAIWAEGSFARAADRLGVVPSALTETVRQVEEIAGRPLFDRRSRPPEPTALGLEFLNETAPLLKELDRSLLRLREKAQGRQSPLRIGATPSAISPLIAPVISTFRQARPTVPVTLHDDIAEKLAEMVSGGHLDLAVAGRARTSPDLIQTEIAADAFGLACHRDHPLAEQGKEVTLADIDPLQLIHLSPDTGTARLISDAALPEPLKSGGLQTHSTIAQLCLVRARVGIAILPVNAVRLFNDPDIRFVPVAGLNLTRRLFLLLPERAAPNESVVFFLSCLKAEIENFRASGPSVSSARSDRHDP